MAILQTPVPVTFPLSYLVLWVLSISAILAATGAIAKFISKASVIINVLPVIIAMAKEFKSDSGSTLRDSINRLEDSAKLTHQATVRAEATAVRAEKAVEHLTTLAERQRNGIA